MTCSQRCRVSLLVLIGLSSAISGVALYLFFPSFLTSRIQEALVISEDSVGYEYWKEPPVPVYTKFYLFNIVNPKDIYYNISKPLLEEVGPYTFRVDREKQNITWHENGTVSYIELKRFYYRPELSNGSLDDVITTLNAPLIASSQKAKTVNSFFLNMAMSAYFESMNISCFVRKSVRELLFEGYEDPIIDDIRRFVNVPYDKFGWAYKKNGTADGMITIFTGEKGLSNIGMVDKFNGLPYIGTSDPPCNKINGSAGQTYPPLFNINKISIFMPRLCRTLFLTYLHSKRVKGIEAFRYYSDHSGFDNGQKNPVNKCYCSKNGCLPSGAHDVSTCPPGTPAVVSLPHFLFADSSYSRGVDGLKPDPRLHLTYMDINPDTGILLQAAMSLQISMVFEGNEGLLSGSDSKQKIYFPVIWVKTYFTMTDEITDKMKLILYTIPNIIFAIAFFLVGFGSVLVIAAFFLAVVYRCTDPKPVYSIVHNKPVDLSDFSYVKNGNGSISNGKNKNLR